MHACIWTHAHAWMQLSLRKEIGRLFCLSLNRYPSADIINVSLRTIKDDHMWNVYYIDFHQESCSKTIWETCARSCSQGSEESTEHILHRGEKTSTWDSHHMHADTMYTVWLCRPTESLCLEATAAVMNNMVDFMKAPKSAVYARHLALLVSVHTIIICISCIAMPINYNGVEIAVID